MVSQVDSGFRYYSAHGVRVQYRASDARGKLEMGEKLVEECDMILDTFSFIFKIGYRMSYK